MRYLICCLLIMTAAAVWAQAKLPLEFDKDPGWVLRPGFLGNPSSKAEVSVADGAITFRLDDPGKGMKFELPLVPFDSGYYSYLVVRYKAENLAGGGYALWAFDGSRGGLEIINPQDLTQDGQWHAIAVDMVGRGVTGAVRSLVVEVQCKDKPATLSLDAIVLRDEVSEHTKIVPEELPSKTLSAVEGEAQEHALKFADLPEPKAEPGWLAQDALKYGAAKEGGLESPRSAAHLWAEGQDAGMKFSVKLPEPVDLSRYRFAAIRYRAKGLAPWGDYAVWLGSSGGGLPDQYLTLVPLNALKNDGEWHVAIMPVSKQFKATDMALQVTSQATRGDIWLDSIRFSTKRPLLEMADVLPFAVPGTAGVSPARLAQYRPVDLKPSANVAGNQRLRAHGLKSWFPPGKITVRGIPFTILDAQKDAVQTPPDIDQTASVNIGGKPATEAYLLLLSRLPASDAARMGDPVPMESFRNPERFRVRVEYADGLVDEMFPIACGSGEFEVSRGPEVYCLTGLRNEPIKTLGLVNRMESGSFILAAVTLNEGKAVTEGAEVQELPAKPAFISEEMSALPNITATADGYDITSMHLCLQLQTRGAIRLKSLQPECLTTYAWATQTGPLFEIGDGTALLDSTQVTVGEATLQGPGKDAQGRAGHGKYTLTVPFNGAGMSGNLIVTVGADTTLGWHPDIGMQLDLTNTSGKTLKPIVNFPILRGVKMGDLDDTWYLYCRKGGLVSNRPAQQRQAYGGQYPLQVADVFNPKTGGGLALLTYDLKDVYRFWNMSKDGNGVTWKMEYWPQEVPPGGKIETVPTALRAHYGDWRDALRIYRRWAQSWFKPMVPRKRWFQEVFYYQQTTAWGALYDHTTGAWRMSDFIKRCKDVFGCLDYLHVFDFGDSRIYGRVGDYNHYNELGGLPGMRAAFKEAQDQGVRMGLYIEGYLCDDRGVWGRPNVPANCIRMEDGKPLMWPGSDTEHMMCPAAQGWRDHLGETYKRVAGELQPDGMYIDQYGFIDTWKTCWSREHGHPVPAAPMRGEGATTQAIRSNIPPPIANLTEETPNDVHAQYQDGALGYSVVSDDPVLAPHRVDLFRFMFPDFKVFQLVSYNPFVEGGWDLLKWPFFNGEGWWLGGDPQTSYCPDARNFLRQAFAILHTYKDAFCSQDVEPLVPTLMPTVYANRFTGPKATAWTLFNAEYRTMRGDLLSVRHREGTRYLDAFTGKEIKPRIVKGQDIIPVTIGPRDVGCMVAEYGR